MHKEKEKKANTIHLAFASFSVFSLSVSAPLDVFSMFTLQIQNMPTRECCVKV